MRFLLSNKKLHYRLLVCSELFALFSLGLGILIPSCESRLKRIRKKSFPDTVNAKGQERVDVSSDESFPASDPPAWSCFT